MSRAELWALKGLRLMFFSAPFCTISAPFITHIGSPLKEKEGRVAWGGCWVALVRQDRLEQSRMSARSLASHLPAAQLFCCVQEAKNNSGCCLICDSPCASSPSLPSLLFLPERSPITSSEPLRDRSSSRLASSLSLFF